MRTPMLGAFARRFAVYGLVLLALANCASTQFRSLDRVIRWSAAPKNDEVKTKKTPDKKQRIDPVDRRPRATLSEWLPDGCELKGAVWGSVRAVGHSFEDEVERAAEDDMAARAKASGANVVVGWGLGHTIDSITRYGYAFRCDDGALAAIHSTQARSTCRAREFPLPPTKQHQRWKADVGAVFKTDDCRLIARHKMGSLIGRLGVDERFQFPAEDCQVDLAAWQRNVLQGDAGCRERLRMTVARREKARERALSVLAYGISIREETRAWTAFQEAMAIIDQVYGLGSQARKYFEKSFPAAREACQREGVCDAFGTSNRGNARSSPAAANRYEETGATEIDRLRDQGRIHDALSMSLSFAKVGAFQDPGASSARYLSRMARILLFDLDEVDSALKLLESSVDTLQRLQADQKQPSFGFLSSYSVSDVELAGIFRTLAVARAISGDGAGARKSLRETCRLGGCGPSVLDLPYTQVQEHVQALYLTGDCAGASETLKGALRKVEKQRTRDARWADGNLTLAILSRVCTGKLNETLLEKALHDQIALSLVNAGESGASPAFGLGERLASTFISWALEAPQATERIELAFASATAKKGALWSLKSRYSAGGTTDSSAQELRQAYAELSRIGMEAIAKELQNPNASQIWTEEHWKWRMRAEELERVLARQKPLSVRDFVGLQRSIPGSLPRRSLAIEYVRYRPRSFEPHSTKPWGPPRYAAFVVRRDGALRLIDLGDAERIERRIDDLLISIQACDRCPSRGLVLTQTKDILSDPSRDLFNDLLGPIGADLDSSNSLLIAPDGAMSRVPFTALQREDGRVLLETGPAIQVLPSVLQVTRRTKTGSSDGLLVVGDLSYGPVVETSPLGRFRELTFSRAEAAKLTQLWREKQKPVRELRGLEATKQAVTQAGSYGVLHLATHGWFVPPSPKRQSYLPRSFFVPESADRAPPLVRSGLALAQANETPDGQWTALEVSGLNLSKTQLVVLSACQSARGEAAGEEGVFGLNRAFLAAGAESVVSTLWDVADEATSAFMIDYHSRLLRGEDRVLALVESARGLRKNAEWRDPWFWAPFIISGQAGAIRSR